MEKNKSSIVAWSAAIFAIIAIILLIAATIFSVLNIEIISNECSNWSGAKPTFNVAVIIASVAVGIQIFAIILAIIASQMRKRVESNQMQRSAV